MVNIRYKTKEYQENIWYFRFKTILLQSNSVLHWFTEERKARSYD